MYKSDNNHYKMKHTIKHMQVKKLSFELNLNVISLLIYPVKLPKYTTINRLAE